MELWYKRKRSGVWERRRSLSCLDVFGHWAADSGLFSSVLFSPNPNLFSSNMEEIKKALGNRIRELRTQRGFSQKRFARRCGLHPSYMGEIERGETNLTLGSLILITRRLRTTIAQIFDGIG